MPGHKTTAEVAVIGGGEVGLSVAYHCARAGLDTVLLELEPLRTPTTARMPRPVRTYHPGKVHDSELSVRSLADYRSFGPAGGADLVVRDLGWLVVLTSPEQAAALEAELPAQRDVGVQLELLTAAQAVERNPWLDPAGIEAAIWCPQSHLVDVERVARGYLQGAREHSAHLRTDVTATDIDAATGRVTTTDGEVTASAIVIAAGPVSGDIAKTAGLDLPVWAQFAELFGTDPVGADGEVTTPFTVHPEAGLKTLGTGSSFMVGLERLSQRPGMRDVWFDEAVRELAAHYPRLAGVPLRSTWTGTVDATPSKTAVIGRGTGEHERLLFAAGYTGQDLGQADASGRIIRDLCLGAPPDVDLNPFSLAANSWPPPSR
jgi:sarcosine oxidase subunit beta